MVEAGIPSFKMYMTYPAMMIGDQDMFCALQELKKYGCIAGVHCENSGVIDALVAQKKAAGELSPASHPVTRPNALEAEAVASLLRMAQVADVPVIIVHLSTKEALEEVRIARARGQTVYVETCPHYLLLDDSRYTHPEYGEAAKFVCAPPLRKQADQEALWHGLANGTVQTVATDHCSFTTTQKDAGKSDFTKIPGGMPGVESRGILLWSEGVVKGRLTASQMCRVLSENAAKLYGAWPRKGSLSVGSDADIVVLDPNKQGLLTAADQAANSDYCPYEGLETSGVIEQVYLRGRLTVHQGKILAADGIYISRKAR